VNERPNTSEVKIDHKHEDKMETDTDEAAQGREIHSHEQNSEIDKIRKIDDNEQEDEDSAVTIDYDREELFILNPSPVVNEQSTVHKISPSNQMDVHSDIVDILRRYLFSLIAILFLYMMMLWIFW